MKKGNLLMSSDMGLLEVPESVIIKAASVMEANSSFDRLMKTSEEYRTANMTPMFLYDSLNGLLYCFAKETFGKKLH
jgi:hypothetical protein